MIRATPTFSVIIPLYNKEKDIRNTLQSVLKQTFTDYEIIVVDDGSTDAGAQVVKGLKDDRIKLFTKKNEGVSKARNLGVEKASASYIAFLDADDYWYPNHLENLRRLIQTYPEAKWFLTAYEKKRTKNFITKMVSEITTQPNGWMGIVDDYFKHSLVDCLAWTSAVCMRKDFFLKLKGFDYTITNGAGEDTDLWLRAALISPPAFINWVSARHNLDGSNRISHTPTLNRVFMNLDKYEGQAEHNPNLKKYLDLNRYSYALQHKLAGDIQSYKKYKTGIDIKNISFTQRILLQLPVWLLKLLLKAQVTLEKKGYRLTSF